jgi:hypothetical protein
LLTSFRGGAEGSQEERGDSCCQEVVTDCC